MRPVLVIAFLGSLLVTPLPASSQSIEVGELGMAQIYDVGPLNNRNGGLGPNLWQGTSAERATQLIKAVPIPPDNIMVERLLSTTLLSEGVPPTATTSESLTTYRKARLDAIIRLGDMRAAKAITNRTPDLSSDTQITANLALLAGDNKTACSIADRVVEGRGLPVWARLRAFCHILRGEIPAAELTADIMRNTGYEDPTFFSLLQILSGGTGTPDFSNKNQDPLYAAMAAEAALDGVGGEPASRAASARIALNPLALPKARLQALYNAGPALSDNQMITVLKDLIKTAEPPHDEELESETQTSEIVATEAPPPTPPLPNLASVLEMDAPEATGHLYRLSVEGSQADRPKAIAELLRRAEAAGSFARMSQLMRGQIQTLSPEEQVITDVVLFTRSAILHRDIGALQQFFALLDDQPALQNRIALAADALGYGFANGGLGLDIETRLVGKDKARAQRDAYLAMALGARPSDETVGLLMDLDNGSGQAAKAGSLLLLDASASSVWRAETALRVALILSQGKPDDTTLASLVKALVDAGLIDQAGQIAALDFWDAAQTPPA